MHLSKVSKNDMKALILDVHHEEIELSTQILINKK